MKEKCKNRTEAFTSDLLFKDYEHILKVVRNAETYIKDVHCPLGKNGICFLSGILLRMLIKTFC